MALEYDPAKPHVFLSYARTDADRVKEIRVALAAHGINVWWDDTIQPGMAWSSEIAGKLVAAACVLVVWSERAAQSEWVRAEAGVAMHLGTLVSLTLGGTPPQPFSSIQAQSLAGWSGDPEDSRFARKVVPAVRNAARRPASAPESRRRRVLPHIVYGSVISGLTIALLVLFRRSVDAPEPNPTTVQQLARLRECIREPQNPGCELDLATVCPPRAPATTPSTEDSTALRNSLHDFETCAVLNVGELEQCRTLAQDIVASCRRFLPQ